MIVQSLGAMENVVKRRFIIDQILLRKCCAISEAFYGF